jgi:hypothetical protein
VNIEGKGVLSVLKMKERRRGPLEAPSLKKRIWFCSSRFPSPSEERKNRRGKERSIVTTPASTSGAYCLWYERASQREGGGFVVVVVIVVAVAVVSSSSNSPFSGLRRSADRGEKPAASRERAFRRRIEQATVASRRNSDDLWRAK